LLFLFFVFLFYVTQNNNVTVGRHLIQQLNDFVEKRELVLSSLSEPVGRTRTNTQQSMGSLSAFLSSMSSFTSQPKRPQVVRLLEDRRKEMNLLEAEFDKLKNCDPQRCLGLSTLESVCRFFSVRLLGEVNCQISFHISFSFG
jgi:hypothetical protein